MRARHESGTRSTFANREQREVYAGDVQNLHERGRAGTSFTGWDTVSAGKYKDAVSVVLAGMHPRDVEIHGGQVTQRANGEDGARFGEGRHER